MESETSKRGLLQSALQKITRLAAGDPSDSPAADADLARPDVLTTLEQLQSGQHPNYCLYLGPTGIKSARPDMESLLVSAFAPLPWVALNGYKSPLRRLPTEGRLAEEAFGTLAQHARVLLIVPGAEPQLTWRLRWLKQHDHLWRAVFLMPADGSFAVADWAAAWESARPTLAAAGLELPPYTAGGWLFRYATDAPAPRAATFRMIAHPNAEKIARALEAVCGEMSE